MLTPCPWLNRTFLLPSETNASGPAFELANMIGLAPSCVEHGPRWWGWPLGDNPLSLIRMPKNNPPRERRLRSGEYEALGDAAGQSKSWYLWPIVDIAIETAMRRSEILNLEWQHIDWKTQRALLPITKNGRSRWVPFSELALKHLEQVPRTADRFFPITDVAFRQAWDRLRNRAGITDLKFHDLRHEGLSQMFESGMSIPQVMAISGHRTASQLFRYVQLYELGPVPSS